MELDDIAASRPTGCSPRGVRATPASTSSTSTGATRYLLTPVPVAVLQQAHRRVRRLAREPRPHVDRDARRRFATPSGDDCAIAVPDRSSPWRRGLEVDEALEFVRLADHLVDLWDVNVGSIAEWSLDSGASRFFARGLPARVDRPRARGDLEADRRRRALHESGPHGRGRSERRVGPDRRRPAVDRRPVPAAQDRGGPLRGSPRVHRLQRLHLEVGDRPPHGLHAERDRRRGVPPRLAPGAVRAGATNADRDVLVVGAGAAGMECAIVLGKRGLRRVHLVDAEPRDRRAHALDSRACPGLGEWARVVNWRRIQLEKLTNVEVDHRRARWTRPPCASTGRRSSSWRRARAGPANGLNGRDARAAAGRGRDACPTCSRRSRSWSRASGRPGAAWRSTTARGTSWLRDRRAAARRRASDVELVTPLEQIAPCLRRDARGPAAARAPARPPASACTARRDASTGGSRGRAGEDEYGDPFALAVDGVVLVTQRLSNDEPVARAGVRPRRLDAEGIEALYRIGDCVVTADDRRRDLRRAPARARDRHAENPARPLPYLRERPWIEQLAMAPAG